MKMFTRYRALSPEVRMNFARCYGHNRTWRHCPTPISCLYGRLLSELGWALIHYSVSRLRRRKDRAL